MSVPLSHDLFTWSAPSEEVGSEDRHVAFLIRWAPARAGSRHRGSAQRACSGRVPRQT